MFLNTLFRLLLTFNATSLLVIVFSVKSGFTLQKLFCYFGFVNFIPVFHNLISYFLYVLILLLLTKLSIWISSYLGKDSFECGQIISIEYANNSFYLVI